MTKPGHSVESRPVFTILRETLRELDGARDAGKNAHIVGELKRRILRTIEELEAVEASFEE